MAERTSTFVMFFMGSVRYRVYEFEFGNKFAFRLLESAYTMYSIASRGKQNVYRRAPQEPSFAELNYERVSARVGSQLLHNWSQYKHLLGLEHVNLIVR